MDYHSDKDKAHDDFDKLLGFYLACIEEEDKRSLQVSANKKFKQYALPAGGEPGSLFRGTTELLWKPAKIDCDFIQKYSLDLTKQRFLYGYPFFFDEKGNVSPLFFSEADLVLADDLREIAVHLPHPGNIQVNLHLFCSTRPSLLERLELQESLEEASFGTIDARITAALDALGENARSIAELNMPQGRTGWKNKSILIRDSGATFTAQLRQELHDLKSTMPSVKGTAIAPLLRCPCTDKPTQAPLLEISPLNRSQRRAVGSALTQPITVITGPPGTGKSQVVVAVLASMGAEGLPVLFASKNNQAVDVVRERLTSILGDADWFLRLGNKGSIDEEMQRRIAQADAMTPVEDTTQEVVWETLREAVSRRDSLEKEIMERGNRVERHIAVARRERLILSKLPGDWRERVVDGDPLGWLNIEAATEVRRRLTEVRALSLNTWPGLWLWLKRFVFGDRLLTDHQEFLTGLNGGKQNDWPLWASSVDEATWQNVAMDFGTLDTLRQYRDVALEKERISDVLFAASSTAELEQALKAHDLTIHDASVKLARGKMLGRVNSCSTGLTTLIKQYWQLTQKAAKLNRAAAKGVQSAFGKSAKGLLEAIPGAIVTSLSSRRSLPVQPGLFECVIIDEASQCDIASAIPLLLRAKRLVVIGDPKQLRHISSITEETEQRIAAAEGATGQLASYSYRSKSLYDCAAEALDALGGTYHFLDEHYRSHPEIIEFSNRVYYQRRLVVRTPCGGDMEQAVFWHDVPSEIKEKGGSLLNPKEAEKVSELVKKLINAPSFKADWTLGIVTPYRMQRNYLERLLTGTPELAGRLKIGTVHSFQGAECDVMVFSPVVADGAKERTSDWISKEEGLLNVALTRARRGLHVVGDKSFCRGITGPLGDLAEFVNGLERRKRAVRTDNPAVVMIRNILQELGLWYQEEFPEHTARRTYYLDFFIVGLSGTRYNIEVDGRQHFFSPEAMAEDDARDEVLTAKGYKVVRLQAGEVTKNVAASERLLASLL